MYSGPYSNCYVILQYQLCKTVVNLQDLFIFIKKIKYTIAVAVIVLFLWLSSVLNHQKN